MCVLAIAWMIHADLPLVLIGNRDEFHARSSALAGWWDDPQEILGGRDLEAGGSWLAVNLSGRLAVVTNFRESATPKRGERSRGELVVNALVHSGSVSDFAADLGQRRADYGTRASTVVVAGPHSTGFFSERSFDSRGAMTNERRFDLALSC